MSGPSRPRARQETPPDQAGRENQPAGARRGRTLPPAGNLAGTPPLAGNLAGERSQPGGNRGQSYRRAVGPDAGAAALPASSPAALTTSPLASEPASGEVACRGTSGCCPGAPVTSVPGCCGAGP